MIVVLLSWVLAWIAVRFGGYFELLALVSGFIFVAPVLAVGTYAISDQLEHGERPSLRRCIREERRAFGNLMVFALMLMVVFLVWWRAGSAVHVFFPVDTADATWRDYAQFLASAARSARSSRGSCSRSRRSPCRCWWTAARMQ